MLSIKKTTLTPNAQGTGGSYAVADAELVDIIDPRVKLDTTGEAVRLASYAAVAYLILR